MAVINDAALVRSEHFCEEDRISELSCGIIIHILSFLTLKQSARTSILSKLWRDRWLRSRRLDFDAYELLMKEEDRLPDTAKVQIRVDTNALYEDRFVELVNSVLTRYHKSYVIDEFRLRFGGLHNSFETDINNWLEFALSKRVQTLELNLLINCHTRMANLHTYGFPSRIVDQRSNETSKESPPLPDPDLDTDPDDLIRLNNHILNLRDFDSLRSLSLARVNVSGEVISFLLKKCQNLERIKVCTCETLFSLEVCGTFPALKHLEICHCSDLTNVIVRDTNLVSLKLHKVSILENNPKLVEVCVASINPCVQFSSITLPLLVSGSGLSQVQVLTLDVTLFKAAEVDRVRGLSQLTELKQLNLIFRSTPNGFMHLTSLINLSPSLKKFVLQLTRDKKFHREDRSLTKGPKIPLEHLKTVEFRGYCGRVVEDEFIIFFCRECYIS